MFAILIKQTGYKFIIEPLKGQKQREGKLGSPGNTVHPHVQCPLNMAFRSLQSPTSFFLCLIPYNNPSGRFFANHTSLQDFLFFFPGLVYS
jgi:hypothetical protein